jgi:hypothetical protein
MSDFIRDLAGLTWREIIKLWGLSVLCCQAGVWLAGQFSQDGPPLSFNPWPPVAGFIGMTAAYPLDRYLRTRRGNGDRNKVASPPLE